MANGAAPNQQCRCAKASECAATGCCAPIPNAQGLPAGPYVCKPADGKAYDCCTAQVPCDTSHCCVNVAGVGNQVCELPCTTDGDCGPGGCVTLGGGTCIGKSGACFAR
jgi:hypothetical protein